MNSHDNDHGDNYVDVDPEGGSHGDAAGDVPHPPLLGKLQVSNFQLTSTRERLFHIFAENFGLALNYSVLSRILEF